MHVAGRRSLLWHHVGEKGRNSFYALFAIVGALIGAQLAMEGTSSPAWYSYAIVLLVILFKAALTWVCVSWVKAISATVVAHAESRNDPTNVRRANKITTQAQILRRSYRHHRWCNHHYHDLPASTSGYGVAAC